MNLQEQQFDELMREKLAGYSEPPDFSVLPHIHAKKTRVLRLHGMYRLLIIASLIGAGLWGSIEAGKQIASKTAIKQKQDVTETSNVSTSATNNEASFITVDKISNTQHNEQKTRQNKEEKTNTRKEQSLHIKQSTKNVKQETLNAKSKNIEGKTIAESPEKNTTTRSSGETAEINNAKNNIEKSEEDNDVATSCVADFSYYVSYNGEVNFTNFSDAHNTAKMVWEFGDGETSSAKQPVHNYAKGGTYHVTLSLRDNKHGCEHRITKTITIGLPVEKQLLRLKGMVRGGSKEYRNSMVELLAFSQQKQGYEIFATTSANVNGEFEFNELKAGNYLLRANPSLLNNGYITTYWGNTREADYAGEINISAADNELAGYSIDLIFDRQERFEEPIANPIATKDAGKTILIFDQNNNLVGTTTVDANGNFNIGDIPLGNYKAVDPTTGKSTRMGSSGTGNISDMGAGNTNSKVTLSPNPAVDRVNVGVEVSAGEPATIIIINSGGVEVLRTTQQLNEGFNYSQLDVSSLPAGVYYVMVIRPGKEIISGQLVK